MAPGPPLRSLLTAAALCATLPTPVQAVCGRDPRQVVAFDDSLAVAICSPRVARIVRVPPVAADRDHAAGGEIPSAEVALVGRESLVVQPGYSQPAVPGEGPPVVRFDVARKSTAESGDYSISINTTSMRIMISSIGGPDGTGPVVAFFNSRGELITAETGSNFAPIEGTNYSTVSQSWQLDRGEGFYGGGQFVNGLTNYNSAPLLMVQSNTEAAVPFFLSSRGYGLLWDHYGVTMLNPPQEEILLGDDNTARWVAPTSGDYWFYVRLCEETAFGCGSNSFSLYLDEEMVLEHHLANVPSSVSGRVANITKDETYRVRLETEARNAKLYYTSISDARSTTIQSRYSKYIDYYFTAADETASTLDSVIASYRQITGTAYLYPKWAYGFWQCKEHYHNQTELLDAAAKFRELGIPVDNIVQDWLYWGNLGWGPAWDRHIYPDPKSMLKKLKEMNYHFMVSVWSKFDEQTTFYKEMNDKGLLLDGTNYMDAWNPAAAATFFRYSKAAHFDIGVDALWLDATEPENNPHLNKDIFLGRANEYYNTYSLQVSKAVHDGLKDYDNRRIFSLTRSSFAGQQRYGAALWSGDTTASWDSLRRQIAMSLNYQLSGIPLWSMDTGGFFRPSDQYESPDYRKLLTRWFQFAVFTPIMRVHGGWSNTELWNYGVETRDNIVESSITLRYRLLDYIYSGFAKVERDHYTMMRGLVLDFYWDAAVLTVPNQFMFGESFMVAPIFTPDNARKVYLPSLVNEGTWTDFYTGKLVDPGGHELTNVAITQIPIFVRSSVLVLSPKRQHVFEKIVDRGLEVRIYEGHDSSFVLYEDDGLDASRENRPHCTTKFSWNQEKRSLTLGARMGPHYTGMPTSYLVDIVLVAPGRGVGIEPTDAPDFSLVYNGTELSVHYGRGQDSSSSSVKVKR